MSVFFTPLNAAPVYTRGQKMSPCRRPKYTRVKSVFFSTFVCKINAVR